MQAYWQEHCERLAGAIVWIVAAARQEGIRAAVLAGLGVTVQLQDDLKPGMKVIDGRYGLPLLPEAAFTLIWSSGKKTPAAREFGQLLLNMPDQQTNATRKSRRS